MISLGLLEVEKERYEQLGKHDHSIEDDKRFNKENQLRIGARSLLFAANPQPAPKYWDHGIWVKMNTKPLRERVKIAAALLVAELDRTQELIATSDKLKMLSDSRERTTEELEATFDTLYSRITAFYLIQNPKETEYTFKYKRIEKQEVIGLGVYSEFVDGYDGDFQFSVTLPWKFIDMSDEEFETWKKEQTTAIEEKAKQDEEAKTEAALKRERTLYENLKKKFENDTN